MKCGVFTATLVILAALAARAEPIADSSCMDCHADKDLWKTNAAGVGVSLFVDLEKVKASAHKTNTCASCHSDITEQHPDDGKSPQPVDCGSCHKEQTETYGASTHGMALAEGSAGAAGCVDCHGSGHSILPPTSTESQLHYMRIGETCGACHDEEAREVLESVHGEALAKGYREAPTCTDCHSEHKIQKLSAGSQRASADVCSSCHASERINTKFKMPSDRVRTFFDSYHGLAGKYGSATAANCSSCHGVHKILPSTDTNSTIHPTNLAETCGKCHPGATENFAQSKIHLDASSAGSDGDVGTLTNFWVRRIYLILIFGTIGFMALHNGAVFVKKVRARYQSAHLEVPRMDLSQRLQHMVLAASFIWLAISGFALKFPESWFAWMMGSNEQLRSWSHRVAGVVLLLVGAYHIYYVVANRKGRNLVKDLMPTPKDARDLAVNAKYLAGISPEKARIGRFGYAEKMEYWAVVWGTVIMGVTGLMVWFKMEVTQFIPRWIVDVGLTIHYYEAILACLAIIVWHFYHVMFDPDIYPLNWACINGKVSKHWHEDEHPLENIECARAEQAVVKAEEAKPQA